MAHSFSVGALIAIAVSVPATSAAQSRMPAHVRVMTKSEPIMRWLEPRNDIILTVDEGTTLEVIDFDQDKGSYWVVLPPDVHGTRRVGWVHASGVEPYVPPPAAPVAPAFPIETQREEAPPQPAVTPSTSTPPASEDKVTVTVRRDAPPADAATAAGARKSYSFEDVHFERGAFSIRSEDLDRLRVAADALKEDPSLVLTIEGHTCNLGTGAFNLALGSRRANAVKEYLVGAGVPAPRPLTGRQGDAGAENDTSREETRPLNRRVALVPKIER
jgi:outer membrane protein OmpA-like peptidoglycan-associated protein